MKKIILSFLLVFVLLFNFVSVKAASNSVTDSTGSSTFTATKVESNEVYGMDHKIVTGNAVTNGGNYGQYLNALSMKTDGFTSKMVTWAVQKSNTSFVRRNIIDAAKDYEVKNPGWIVVGGINADQYFFNFGTKLGADGSAIMNPSPYYPMVSNGDRIFTISATGNSTNVVGFKNDGSVNSFVGSTGAGKYMLSIIDENNLVTKTFEINGINTNAGDNQTTYWSSHFSTRLWNTPVDQNVETTNNLYIVKDAELSYMSMYQNGTDVYFPGNYNTNTMFSKGFITDDTVKSCTLSGGDFAIETTNSEVIAELKKGVHIKVEQYYANEDMNAVEEAIGYHSVHRINGVDNSSTAPYNTQHYSRALVGRKADGTYILITADFVTGLGSYGLNWTECNAVAEYFGVQDMYQMDGGGSVTAMVRQSDGSFKVTNYPKDSGNPNTPRENLSYLFFVIRDPGVQCLDNDITYHSVKLTKKDIKGNATISNIKVTLNGQTYDFNNDELEINHLAEKTQYKLDVSYDVTIDGKTKHSSFVKEFTTKAYEFPTDLFEITSINKNTVDFAVKENEYSDNLSNVVLYVGDYSFNVGTKKNFTADNLFESEEYVYYFTYDIYDPISETKYHNTTEEKKFTTKSYNPPIIEEFKENKKDDTSISFLYKYVDSDRVVSSAYLLLNGEKVQDVTAKTGLVKAQNLDFKANTYIFQLVVEYNDGSEKIYSAEIKYEKPAEEKPIDDPNKEPEVQPTQPENPVQPEETGKKKCGKKSAELIVSLISTVTLLAFVIKKRK